MKNKKNKQLKDQTPSTTKGESNITDLLSSRSGLRLLQKAVKNNWEIPEYVISAVPKILAQMLGNTETHTRDRIRLIETIATLARDNINLAVALDKVERLEAGEATDHVKITPEIRTLADEIIKRRISQTE